MASTAETVTEYFSSLSSVPMLLGRASELAPGQSIGSTITVTGAVALMLMARGCASPLIGGTVDTGGDTSGEAGGL